MRAASTASDRDLSFARTVSGSLDGPSCPEQLDIGSGQRLLTSAGRPACP
jgi:hypothetical protein